ncbi:MAG: D-aminoacylase [Candidatus Marinimicrobia bacterium]|nr:D-aminoacylase [Candidatus Neomarinimicrobiota bacterium]
MPPVKRLTAGLLALIASSCAPDVDTLIVGGTIYDGSGNPPYVADLAISGDTIFALGNLDTLSAATTVDAHGLAVSPGFINMLSWSVESLLEDGRGQSDILQGVTLEVFGEGWSMGPLNEDMRKQLLADQGDIRFEVTWTTLGEYLQHLEDRGVSPNVASFIGAGTVRIHEVGYDDRPATPEEIQGMKALVAAAMEEGALGVGSSLIYSPDFFATTEELIEISKVASSYGGMYISHLRSEGNGLLQAVEELLTIAREANIAAEIYHLKAAGRDNWKKLDQVISKVQQAQKEGLAITADIYTYTTAGATGLDAAMPPWVQAGGDRMWAQRLRSIAIRFKLQEQMSTPTDEWESLLLAAGSPSNVILTGFKSDSLKYLTGKTLAEVAEMWDITPEMAAIELVLRDGSRVEAVYFIMSEENVRKKVALPWVAFNSDASAQAPEGNFLKSNPHPRAYGNFARLLGKYVRDEKIVSLQEAIRRLTSFPADNLMLRKRGRLEVGRFADVVIFDPATISDHATYLEPHQYSTGVSYVWVNGSMVLKKGHHTGATPGRFVKGPGWSGWQN